MEKIKFFCIQVLATVCCMALLTACNLIAIVSLGKYVFRLLDDYRAQKRSGIKDPIFHRSQLPEIEHELECWD